MKCKGKLLNMIFFGILSIYEVFPMMAQLHNKHSKTLKKPFWYFIQECRNTVGSFECSCFDGYLLNDDNMCTIVPAIIDICPDNCSHTCYLSQCTCPEDMYLDPEDRATCRYFTEPEKPVKTVKKLVRHCKALDVDDVSMEIHYSKAANEDGKYEKGTVARGKCR